jgi:GNAT superfamily N-acetyltransferase
MVPTIRIAFGGPADRDAVVQLLLQQFAEHSIFVPQDKLAGATNAVLASDDLGFVLLAYDDGRAVGLAYMALIWTLEHAGRSAWLEELYVAADRRSRGIGRTLLAAALERAREIGCSAIDLEVDERHGRAEHLYRRAGFARLARSRWVMEL